MLHNFLNCTNISCMAMSNLNLVGVAPVSIAKSPGNRIRCHAHFKTEFVITLVPMFGVFGQYCMYVSIQLLQ